MDVSKKLAQAWADVEAAGLPEHVQGVALVEALRMRDGKGAGDAGSGGGRSGGGGAGKRSGATAKKSATKMAAGGEDDAAQIDGDAFFAAIERETDVPIDTLEQLIFLKDGVPRINATKRALGGSLRQSQSNVATIIVVARHFGLEEAEVQDSAVRDECQRLGIFDRNFASNVKGIAGILQAGDRTKVFKVRAAGVNSFVSTVAAVTGKPAAE